MLTFLGAIVMPTTVTAASAQSDVQQGAMTATIRYTEHGVPHILARSFTDLGFGTGYAAAMDNLCLLEDGAVTLAGERSKYFGAEGEPDQSLSSASSNLTSDAFFRAINASGIVERLARLPYPSGPRPEIGRLTRGWVAGFNKYLRENEITDPACKGAPWVRPLTEQDVNRRQYAVAVESGTGLFADEFGKAQPPSPSAAPSVTQPKARNAAGIPRGLPTSMGSNAIAVAGARTATGRGLLLGNPHYPWHGGARFWQMQQTIPGRIDVAGAALIGLPTVAIGFNSSFAWSHTVATGTAFNLTQLKLKPGDPSSYLVDGKPEKMTRHTVDIATERPDGSLKSVTTTRWETRYGPVLTSAGGFTLPWTTDTAYALSDPNVTNLRFSTASLELGMSRTTGDAVRALKRTQGLPWVDTIAADSRGHAMFAQIQVLPNITDEVAARCNTALGEQTFPRDGVAVLDGSTSACAPGKAPGTVQPGILSPDRYPVLDSDDYVSNSNDSYWLANPSRPQEGYDRIIGDERTRLSLRTRSALTSVREQLAESDFTRQDMQNLMLANRDFAGELAADDTVKLCRALNLGAACDALAGWDERNDVTSRGALLFDRFWLRAAAAEDLWTVPFDAKDPVDTPHGLNTASPRVRKALTDAVAELTSAHIPFDAPLGDHHYVVRDGTRIPIGGGSNGLGVLNNIEEWWTPGKGYTEVWVGSSYVQVVAFDGDRCPDARTLLTYSQSTDPSSPYHADQTRLFSRSQWARGRYCEKDIAMAPGLRVVHLRG